MRDADGHLLKVLGAGFGVAIVIGGTIGQGILRSPGLVAAGVPDARLIVALWLLGGMIALIDSMSTVELAASIRRAGGPYIFARRAFGPFTGLAVGVADWLTNIGAAAFVAVVIGEYLHRLGLMTEAPVGLLAALVVLAIGAIHWFGTRVGGRSQEIGSAVKAVLFAILIGALLLAPRGAAVTNGPLAEAGPVVTLSGVIVAIRGIFGTYTGWNGASYFSEEVTDIRRGFVRATFLGIAIVTAIYLLVNIAFLNVLTPAEMAGSTLVAADAAARVFGAAADGFVTGLALVALVTIINMVMMGYPRVVFAVARDAGLPALTRVAANGTPRAALAVTATAGALLATIGVYETLLAFSVVLNVGLSVIVNAAAIRMRSSEPTLERPWRMPLFPLPALFAMTVNGALLTAFMFEEPGTSAQAFALLAALTALILILTRRSRRVAAVER